MAPSLFSFAATAAATIPVVLANPINSPKYEVRSVVPRAEAAVDAVSNHVLEISKSNMPSGSSAALRAMAGQEPVSDHIKHMFGEEYTTTIEWGGVPVNVILDTGSSDTWLFQKGFQCRDKKKNKAPVRPVPLSLKERRRLISNDRRPNARLGPSSTKLFSMASFPMSTSISHMAVEIIFTAFGVVKMLPLLA